ncbi:GNAT family protein [Acetobacterium sp. K1/6]|jgi:Acetyltransferases, including N-acetylases of ribosomal proteins|uniref:GNAT family N-acetyltransferase n=1 Tax=Acetobacterium sp. K1/6 TaxID=3055467 RepID=UPI002AC9FFA4|nr:GNAT family protein [Acetobacterium sp. K1/6]MDZ5723608.1 GNAT family protein [Acetobacterium sp. K1/6]
MKSIITKNLVLRPLTLDDTNDVFDYSKNKNVGPRAGWKPHETIEETEVIMETIFVGQENIWGIEYNKRIIGSIGLIEDPHRQNDQARMLGYALSEDYWGQGIMTEAAKAVLIYGFDTLGLDLISAVHYPFNLGSQRVIEKCGFLYEGTIRQAEKIYTGEIRDVKAYSITREEFR